MCVGSAERGDTLIEVIMALAIFSVATVACIAIMNKGAAQMYDSLERTQARQLIDRQTESLMYARDQFLQEKSKGSTIGMSPADIAASQVWKDIATKTAAPSAPGLEECSTTNAFYINRNASGGIVLANTGLSAVSASFPEVGNGLYMNYMNPPSTLASSVPKYKDFYVRACWRSTSGSTNQVISTVVRLYE